MKEMLSTCPKIEVYMITRSEIRWYLYVCYCCLYYTCIFLDRIQFLIFAFQVKKASF